MLGKEKPFETLLSKEKEGFELCSEIIEWTTPNPKHGDLLSHLITYPGVLELRQEATKLFEQISNMDMAHDDKYFLVHGAIAELRKKYHRLHAAVLREKWPNQHTFSQKYYFDRESPFALISHIKALFTEGYDELRFFFRDPRGGGWGDGADIWIQDCQRARTNKPTDSPYLPKDGFSLHFSELFDYVEFETPYIETVNNALQDILPEAPSLRSHMHDYGGMQYDLFMHVSTLDEVFRTVEAIVRAVQTKPRTEKRNETGL